jgi:hypothetical protein
VRAGLWLFPLVVGGAWGAAEPVELRLDGWTAIVEPGTITVRARENGRSGTMLAAAGLAGGVESLRRTGESVRWSVPGAGILVEFSVRGKRLRARFESSREQTLEWPRTGEDPRFTALILPEREGLYVPLSDAAWRARLARRCFSAHGQLSMPFWSYRTDGGAFTYQILSDIRTELCTVEQGGRIGVVGKHRFVDRDGRPPYELEMWPGGASPIAPALEYREGLARAGALSRLDDKIRANPEVAKLPGAIHMYVWGDGRTVEFLDELRRAGVDRAWIGYDQNPGTRKTLVDRRYIAAAKQAGYLVGPYDTFANAQDPVTGEDWTSRWPGGLYPAGCIADREQRPVRGFAGRGCELSSEALERAEAKWKPIAGRIDAQLRDGANAYFLDVDAFGELYDDYSPAHPMTQAKDRDNRLRRMREVRRRGVVLGSEEGVGWSVAVLDFAHGALSVENAALWPKKKEFGGWWPPERPRIFFQPVDPGADFARAKYDPAYRLPLYEAAFHDAIVATDRWDVPMAKFPALARTRQLLELLYGVPSMWAMDRRQLRDSGPALTKLVQVFGPLHRRIGTLPLTAFDWLTPDRLVQRTRFGGQVTVTANFGSTAYAAVQPGCLRIEGSGSDGTFCP